MTGKTIKIICVEEHVVDLDIGRATHPSLSQRAPYMMASGYAPGGGAGVEGPPPPL